MSQKSEPERAWTLLEGSSISKKRGARENAYASSADDVIELRVW